jgi:hypothetical protein
MPSDEYPPTAGQQVNLDDANREARVSLAMPRKNGVLLVQVVDGSTRLPVELLSASICPLDRTTGCPGDLIRSDMGEYRIYAPPRPFHLKINAPNYQEWIQSEDGGTIAPETSRELVIAILRQPGAKGMALTDREKGPGLYLAAPVQLAPAENEKFDHFPRTTTLKWAKVEGAVSYEVEVDYCQGLGAPAGRLLNECLRPAPHVFSFNPAMKQNTTQDTTYTFSFIGAQPGRWRVWAVDEEGRNGFKSPWRMFSYAR